MTPIIPISLQFDQPTLGKLIEADPIVQRYCGLFALFDWTPLEPAARPSSPGRPAHPPSAYVKALLVRIGEHLSSTPRWRAYLLDHPRHGPRTGLPSAPGRHRAVWLACREDGAQRGPFERRPAHPGEPVAYRLVRPNGAGPPGRDPRPG